MSHHQHLRIASVKRGLLVFVCCLVAARAFILSPTSSRTAMRSSAALSEGSGEPVIFYSPNFHRHVVAEFDGLNCSNVLESFLFLDEAEMKYPAARRVATKYSSKLETAAGLGLEGLEDYHKVCDEAPAGTIPATISSAPPTDRLQLVIEKLSTILGSPFTTFFPEDEHELVLERVWFLLAPVPDVVNDMDVPKALFDGCGAGLTEKQVTSAILALKHLLPANPAAALKQKPPFTYFVVSLGVSIEQLNEARNKLDSWLDRDCAEDAATFAYLHTLGVSWDQCDIILQAFSASVTSCEPKRTRSGPLSMPSIDYLQARLRLPPSEILSMVRLHPRLSAYSVKVLKSHSDALQSSLGISSRGLRELVLGSPSVLGISESKASLRAAFLREKLSLSESQIQKVLKQVPTLLCYSLERNLEPKVNFLIHQAGISGQNLTKVVVARPYILALSLEKSLKPCVVGLRNRCGLSAEDVADMLVRSPSLLTSKWKTSLEPKINFLTDRLGLTKGSLRKMMTSSPRILVQSVATSLEPKLVMLEDAAGGDKALVAQVVQDNPSLLESSMAALTKRVSMFKLRNVTFVEAFSPRSINVFRGNGKVPKPLTRRKRSVLEISPDESIIENWPDVEAAAVSVGTSRANMYNILKTGRLYNGKKYVYGSRPEVPEPKTRLGPNYEYEDAADVIAKDMGKNMIPEDDQFDKNVGLGAILRDSPLHSKERSLHEQVRNKSSGVYLSVFVSAGVYPTERRTKLTAGGLLMYFPQLAGEPAAGRLLQKAAEKAIPYQIIPSGENGTNYFQGIVLTTYPAVRPSRNRCGLFACRSALRMVFELLASDPSLTDLDVEVDVITDSNYIWELLCDPTALLQWGSFSRAQDFVYDGPEPVWRINADILYPLARTYYRMSNQIFTTPSLGDRTKPVAKSITIRFRHESEVSWTREDLQIRSGRKFAKAAAKWQYDREINASLVVKPHPIRKQRNYY